MNPNKNATVLVLDEHPRNQYPKLSKTLMALESVYAEQVGFIEKANNREADYRLQMMGGEFCANAAASLSVYMAYNEELQVGEKTQCTLEISGSDTLVKCYTKRLKKGFRTKITMPCPLHIQDEMVDYKGRLMEIGCVDYADACQRIVYDDHVHLQPKALAKYILHHGMGNDYTIKGVTLCNTDNLSITPLIYVKETDTEIWENSCGIASASLAAYMANKQEKSTALRIIQPSGDYVLAEAIYDKGCIKQVTIEEDVFISAIGTAFIE